jgi:glycosyltransferase involved in cell wall biosynthesis
MSNPSLTVVIPCLNEENYIKDTINSFLGQDCKYDFEILIMDGGSTDNTVSIVNSFSKNEKVRLINNPNKTTPYALNLGIQNSKYNHILIAGAHAFYPSSLLKTLLNYLRDNDEFSCVGSMLKTSPADSTYKSQAISDSSSSPFAVGNSLFRIGVNSPLSVDTVAFGCYKKEVFDEVGLFDTDLTRNQDDEFNARLIKHGHKIALLPDPVIEYYARNSLKKLQKMFYQYGLFKPIVNKKLQCRVSYRQFAPPVFVFSLILSVMISFISKEPVFLAVVCPYFIFLILAFFSNFKNNKNLIIAGFFTFSIVIIHLSYGMGFLKGVYKPCIICQLAL